MESRKEARFGQATCTRGTLQRGPITKLALSGCRQSTQFKELSSPLSGRDYTLQNSILNSSECRETWRIASREDKRTARHLLIDAIKSEVVLSRFSNGILLLARRFISSLSRISSIEFSKSALMKVEIPHLAKRHSNVQVKSGLGQVIGSRLLNWEFLVAHFLFLFVIKIIPFEMENLLTRKTNCWLASLRLWSSSSASR